MSVSWTHSRFSRRRPTYYCRPGGGWKKPDGLQSQSRFAIFHSLPVNRLDKIRRVKPPNKEDSRTVMRIREDKAHARYFSEGPMPHCFCGLCTWSGWTQVRAHCPPTEMKEGAHPCASRQAFQTNKKTNLFFFFRQIFLYTKQLFGFSQWI